MATDLQDMLREALLNNSYDHSSTHMTGTMAWENSFSYLYRMQLEQIAYDAYHYYCNDDISMDVTKLGNLYIDEDLRVCVDIDKDIIDICGREDFRRSSFYKEYFTLDDMLADYEMFHWIPILIIDGQVIWDWEVKVFNRDAMQFRLPSVFKRNYVYLTTRNPETDNLMYIERRVEVLVIENIYWERFNLTKTNLHLDSSDYSFKIETSLMNNASIAKEEKEGVYFVSFNLTDDTDDGTQSYTALLGTQLYDLTETEDGTYLTGKMNSLTFGKMETFTGTIWTNVVFVNRLHRKTLYTGADHVTANKELETEYLIINRNGDFVPYASPVPVENFMVFKHKSDGSQEYDILMHADSKHIQIYYPNIYQIIDPDMEEDDTYKVFYFYQYNTSLKYTCIHDFWFRYLALHFSTEENEMSMEEIFNRVMFGTMTYTGWTSEQIVAFQSTFRSLLNYEIKTYQWAETDFLYNYMQLEVPQDLQRPQGEAFQHKETRFKEWIRYDPWLLRSYVIEQKRQGTNYFLYTSTLDLESRRRTNTDLELDYSYEFSEDMYVFAIRNDRDYPVLLNLRFFADGIFVWDLYQDRKLFMDYLYVPCRYLTDESWIEVELFNEYSYSTDLITFTSMDEQQEFDIVRPEAKDTWPTIADLYILQTPDDENYIYRHLQDASIEEYFDVTECYPEGEWLCETIDEDKPVRFTRLNKFKLQPNTEDILNKEIEVVVTKIPMRLPYTITRTGYPYLALVGSEDNFNYSREYIRVFLNGRLLPDSRWFFYGFYDQPRIRVCEWMEIGDTIYIDIAPFRYKMIYYQQDLEPSETFIDLRDAVTKPFDWRYYDVYVNGRRMAMNCHAITPWWMTIVNLKSLHNIAVYEKERDWEYYGLNYKERIYQYTPEDLFDEPFIDPDEEGEIIDAIIDAEHDPRLPIHPPEDDEPIQDWDDVSQYVLLWSFYYDELIPKGFNNPSVLQFNKRLISLEYPIIYETYVKEGDGDARTETEAANQADAPQCIMLDPDILVEGENEEHLTWVYMVGHPDEDVSEDYLNQTVVINDETYRLGGE